MKNSKLQRLDDVADVIDSLHQTPLYVNNGLSMVRVTDIKGGSLNLKETLKVTHKVYDEFTKKYQPKVGDLLMTRVGSYGACSYINTEEKFCLGQNTVVIKPKIDSEFLYYCLIASNVKNQIKSFVTGSTQKTISLKNIRSLEIPIPSKEEVLLDIAKTLADLDKKIELNNKINIELEAMAKLIYDYWFMQFDFPDANGKPYKSSGGKMVYNEVLKRDIPDGWEVDIINNIIDVKDGTHDSPRPVSEGYHLITSKNLKVEGLDFDNANLISKEDYENINKRSKVDSGDILFSMIGSIGAIYKIDEENIGFAIKNVALYKTSQKEEYRGYIYMFLKSYDMQRYMGNVISGSIQKFIGLGSLRSMPIFVDDETINKFENTTRPIFKKLTLVKLENQKLTELRDWLLPMLMNGQVIVKSKANK